jgi:polyisoprenoid-binding protein YceI
MVAIASTTINRKDFGIDYGLNALLGNKVNLRLKIHLIRAGAEKTSYSAPATKRLN